MANVPLAETTVCRGVIYLKGETGYPDTLLQDLKDKSDRHKPVMDSPIFNATEHGVILNPPKTQVATEADAAMKEANKKAVEEAAIIPVSEELKDVPPVPQVPVAESQGEEGDIPTPLPDDFPYKEQFESAGYNTIESVNELATLTEVEGIGPSREREVRDWIADNTKSV